MSISVQRLPLDERINKDKIIVDRICSDDDFAYYFFHEKCRPLFNNIIWKIYDNDADYDELVNELYLYLKEPGKTDNRYWHRLRTFDYRTSLFDWIKIVAVRKFYTPSSEVFIIPERMIELGVAEELFLEIPVADYRNFLFYNYICNLSGDLLSEKVGVEVAGLPSLSRNAIKYFKKHLKSNHPEYFNVFFEDKRRIKDKVAITPKLDVAAHNNDVELGMDVRSYLEAMPNERYRYVVRSIFIDGKQSEELAEELDTSVSNIYNIKARGIEQLRDIALLSGEIENLNNYIDLITDEIYRIVVRAVFIDKDDYDGIGVRLGLLPSQFRKIKGAAMKELKSLIFK